MALELGLAHPFAAAHAFRNGHPNTVAGGNLIVRIADLAPAAVCIPAFDIQIGIGPEVAILMLLEQDFGGHDAGTDGAAAEVEDEHHIVSGDSLREVAPAVHQRFTGGELHLAVVEERMDIVALFGVVGELDGHGHVFIGQEGDAEIITHACLRGNMALEFGLAHPFAAAHAFRNGHRNTVAGGDLIVRIADLAPAAVRIPAFDVHIGGLPEVALAVHIVVGGIQRYNGRLGLIRANHLTILGTIDELPGNAFEIGHHKQFVVV